MCCRRYSTCLPTFGLFSGSISSHSYKSSFLGIANLLRMLKRQTCATDLLAFSNIVEWARKGLWLNPITYDLLLSADYLLKEADHSRGGSPVGVTREPHQKTTPPHFWLGYFRPAWNQILPRQLQKRKKKKKNPTFKSKLLLFKWVWSSSWIWTEIEFP